MPTAENRAERRKRHAVEVEASQAELRRSISAAKVLVEQSDDMLRRHRSECEKGDAAKWPSEEQAIRDPGSDVLENLIARS